MEDVINMIRGALQKELESESLEELPQDFYGIVALRVKQLKIYELTGISEEVKEAARGLRELLVSMIFDLVELRVRKMVGLGLAGRPIEGDIYERPLMDALNALLKEAGLLKLAVKEGNVKELQERYREYSLGYRMVKFRSGMESFVGIDLAEYGPYEPGDIAVIPFENAKTLIEKGIVEDLGGVQ